MIVLLLTSRIVVHASSVRGYIYILYVCIMYRVAAEQRPVGLYIQVSYRRGSVLQSHRNRSSISVVNRATLLEPGKSTACIVVFRPSRDGLAQIFGHDFFPLRAAVAYIAHLHHVVIRSTNRTVRENAAPADIMRNRDDTPRARVPGASFSSSYQTVCCCSV